MVLWGAGCDERQVPTPPDLSELRAVYAAPTGALTVETLEDAIERFLSSGKPDTDFDELTFIPVLLDKLDQVTDVDAGMAFGDIEIEGEALGTITVHCDEDSAGLKGSGSLKFVMTENGLDPSIWGALTDCNWTLQEPDSEDVLTTLYNGTFNIWLMEQEGFIPNLDEWLAQFNGTFATDGYAIQQVAIDLWWNNETITTRVPLPDGSWYFFTYTIGTQKFGFQDIQGSIECDLEALACTSEDHPIDFIAF